MGSLPIRALLAQWKPRWQEVYATWLFGHWSKRCDAGQACGADRDVPGRLVRGGSTSVSQGAVSTCQDLLDRLGNVVADVTDSEPPRNVAVLAVVVNGLEHLAEANLGSESGDPPIVLARRFARVHRKLLLEPERLLGCEVGLRHWLTALQSESNNAVHGRPATPFDSEVLRAVAGSNSSSSALASAGSRKGLQ